MTEAGETGEKYDAFISYSHDTDKVFGAAIHDSLQSFAARFFRARALRVFIDDASIPMTSDLWATIDDALESSSFLLLLASPGSASSNWVDKEVQTFVGNNGIDNFGIALTMGKTPWTDDDYDPADESNAISEETLRTMTSTGREPLVVDLRSNRGENDRLIRNENYYGLLSTVVSAITDRDKDELYGLHISRLRRRIGIFAGLTAFLIIAVVLTAFFAIVAENRRLESNRQQQISSARELAARSELIRTQRADGLELSVQLAMESMRNSPISILEADQALRNGLKILPVRRTQGRHAESVWRIAYSPDGKWIATGGRKETVVWRSETGKESFRFMGPANDLVFSPDSSKLAIASGRTVKVLDARSQRVMVEMPHGAIVNAITFSPKGDRLASGGADWIARVWDVETGEEKRKLEHAPVLNEQERVFRSPDTGIPMVRYDPEVNCLAFSPDGKKLATGTRDWAVRVWDLETGYEDMRAKQDSVIRDIQFDPKGRWVATASGRQTGWGGTNLGMARLWDPEAGAELARMPHGAMVGDIDLSPDGRWIVSASEDRTARIWELPSGRELLQLRHENRVEHAVFSKDGKWLATGSDDRTARVWGLANGVELARMIHEGGVTGIAFGPQRSTLATVSSKGEMIQWEVRPGSQVATMTQGPYLRGMVFDVTSEWIAITSGHYDPRGGKIGIWSVPSGELLNEFRHGDDIFALTIDRQGELLVTGSEDKTASIWNVDTRKKVVQIPHADGVSAVALSSDKKLLATGGDDGYVRIFDRENWEELRKLEHSGRVNQVRFGPSGQWLATVCADGTSWLWRVKDGFLQSKVVHDDPAVDVIFNARGDLVAIISGNLVRVYEVPSGQEIIEISRPTSVNSIAFHPNGRSLATAEESGDLILWDNWNGGEKYRITHPRPMRDVAFSPDGKLIATGSGETTGPSGEFRILKAETGREISRIQFPTEVKSVSFSPNGRWVAVLRSETVQLYSWRPDDLIAQACDRLRKNFDPEIWKQYFGDEPVRTTCLPTEADSESTL